MFDEQGHDFPSRRPGGAPTNGAMRSHHTPTEPDLALDELGLADAFDGDGDSSADGFVLFSLGPAQLDA
jgi:hypothetical protein